SDDAKKTLQSFEAEWARMKTVLTPSFDAAGGAALNAVQPAAVRALGEAALSQVRTYYDASLEYGRNTVFTSGLYYLATAQAQQEFADLARTMAAPAMRVAPALRALDVEIGALQKELLLAYRPPASIDRHDDFIAADSLVNEARQLNQAGLRYGALLRYLQAV